MPTITLKTFTFHYIVSGELLKIFTKLLDEDAVDDKYTYAKHLRLRSTSDKQMVFNWNTEQESNIECDIQCESQTTPTRKD